ncbi:hypothetical protein EGJ31_23960 [Serratia marcescens]|nr:hypothetical protein BVG91_08720 [Serratia marcescens]AVD63043.1 hypothetical protein C4B62_07395 [Serratia marcescens]AWC68724.1 hypothetical protein AM368_00025 [Serratia marcescens]AWC76885.1 hypothetical protein AM371_18975 [Serratia marcescens]AWC91129.1 hypothetical protein AM370_20140 [Serratia marcescens]
MRCRVDGRIEMGVEKDRLITEAPVLQVAAEITAVTAGFSHSCQKTALMAVVPVPVVSGGMAVLQEMGTAAMALGREKPENSEPNAN